MEAYLVDDLKGMVTNRTRPESDGSFVVFDIETTGFFAPELQDHRDRRGPGGGREDHGPLLDIL